jgi:hypothetical protein
MTDKVHGFSWPGQHLTGNLNTYIVRTLVNITPTGTASYSLGTGPNYSDVRVNDSQYNLDNLVQTISGRGQPIFMGNIVTTTETSPSDLPAAGTVSPVTVYSMMFMIEHNQSWEVTGNNPDLAETLNGVLGFVYTTPTANNNVSVTLVTASLTSTLMAAALSIPLTKES